jgi:hypothetical protein
VVREPLGGANMVVRERLWRKRGGNDGSRRDANEVVRDPQGAQTRWYGSPRGANEVVREPRERTRGGMGAPRAQTRWRGSPGGANEVVREEPRGQKRSGTGCRRGGTGAPGCKRGCTGVPGAESRWYGSVRAIPGHKRGGTEAPGGANKVVWELPGRKRCGVGVAGVRYPPPRA